MQHVLVALAYNRKNNLFTAFSFLYFHSLDAPCLGYPGRRPVRPPLHATGLM